MRLFGLEITSRQRAEPRSALENPATALSDVDAWASILGDWRSAAGIPVTVESALSVPAFWCGVNFLSGMLASLPVPEFERTENGRERVSDSALDALLSGTVNEDYLTSFKWRKGLIFSALTTGAGRSFVERDRAGRPMNVWPLETGLTTKVRENGRMQYRYRDGGRTVTYQASEIIDITWLPKSDGLNHYNPIDRLKDTIGLALALERYASKFFQNGGVPPLALHTVLGSPGAQARAKSDTSDAIRKANKRGDQVLVVPIGSELKEIGFDPAKGQLVEAQRFVVEQFARILNLPPVFLQDLTHGTFTNTEQQDLHLVKHVAGTWVQDLDQEFNAKFYPRRTSGRSPRYVEHNLDGLLRGDFKTRMEGWARGVQGGIVMPNEARRAENRPDAEGGDRLYIQGATVPIQDAGKLLLKASPRTDPDAPD